jgi:hypothetical protein
MENSASTAKRRDIPVTVGHSAPVMSDKILHTFWLTDLFSCTLAREGKRLRVHVTAAGRPLFTELCGSAPDAARRAKMLRGIFGHRDVGTPPLLTPPAKA